MSNIQSYLHWRVPCSVIQFTRFAVVPHVKLWNLYESNKCSFDTGVSIQAKLLVKKRIIFTSILKKYGTGGGGCRLNT